MRQLALSLGQFNVLNSPQLVSSSQQLFSSSRQLVPRSGQWFKRLESYCFLELWDSEICFIILEKIFNLFFVCVCTITQFTTVIIYNWLPIFIEATIWLELFHKHNQIRFIHVFNSSAGKLSSLSEEYLLSVSLLVNHRKPPEYLQ